MAASTQLQVRPVRGRVIDPYRGAPDEAPEAAPRSPRRGEAQPFDAIAAVIKGMAETKVIAQGKRFKLRRADETLRISFASAAPRVSLDDASFDGDPLLAIDVLHALVPLLGAMELRAGDHHELIDGHEPASAAAGRYRAHWIAASLERAKQIPNPQAPTASTPAPVPIPVTPLPVPRRDPRLFYGGLAAVALVVFGFWYYRERWSKQPLGDACTAGSQCRSGECLPNQPARRDVFDHIDAPIASPRLGVCTASCDDDHDCPSTMICGPVLRYRTTSHGQAPGTKVDRCIARESP